MDSTLSLIGLALRAGKLAVGEEPCALVCRARDCRLLLLASDAGASTLRRAQRMAEEGQCLAKARKSKALERAFETAIPAEVYDQLEQQMGEANG